MKKQLLLILLSLFLFSCEKEELNMSEVEQEEVEQEEIKLEVLSPMVNWLGSLRISSDKVMLEWYAADTNSIAFELEKKVGTADFQVIARLDTADVGKFVTTYNFTDSNPPHSVTTYYRVRSFSANDTSEYSTSPPLVVGELIKTSDYNFGRFYSELTKLGNGEVLMIGGR